MAPAPASPARGAVPPSTGPAERPGPSGDLAPGWQRVLDEVKGKKAGLGAVLAQATPLALHDGELTITLVGNQFHRDMLADRANYDIVSQAIKRSLNADRLSVTAEAESAGSPTAHPAVQAAIAEFEGEVVAVRPRPPEGEDQ